MRVCPCGITVHLCEPGEGYLLFRHFNRKAVRADCLFHEYRLGIHDPLQVLNSEIRKAVPRNRHRKPLCGRLWRVFFGFGYFLDLRVPAVLRLTLKACGSDGFKHLLDLLAVCPIIEEERSLLRDREIVDLIVAGRHEFVFSLCAGGVGDDFDQFLALCAGYVVPDFHL